MSAYRYRAATAEGRIVEGVLSAASRDGALDDLRARSLYPVSLEETAESPGGGMGMRGGAAARIQLTRTLATLLEAGFPLDRALLVAAELADDARLRGIVQAVRQDVRAGRPVAEAFAAHPAAFPRHFVAMVAAGEAGRSLGTAFTRLADQQEEAAALRAELISSLIYPGLMISAGGLAVGLLVFLVVPRFAGVLQDAGAELPWSTSLLLATTGFAVRYGWILALLVGGAVWGVLRLGRTPEGRLRRDGWLLRLPVVGELVLRVATARMTRSLAMLLHSGVPLLSALEIARETAGNEVLRRRTSEAIQKVREGSTLTQAVAPFLPRLAVQMIGVGEETSLLPDMLARVASTYDQEVRATLKRAVALVEPALILIFGAVVGFVALGMLQAIYSINAGSL